MAFMNIDAITEYIDEANSLKDKFNSSKNKNGIINISE